MGPSWVGYAPLGVAPDELASIRHVLPFAYNLRGQRRITQVQGRARQAHTQGHLKGPPPAHCSPSAVMGKIWRTQPLHTTPRWRTAKGQAPKCPYVPSSLHTRLPAMSRTHRPSGGKQTLAGQRLCRTHIGCSAKPQERGASRPAPGAGRWARPRKGGRCPKSCR